MMNEETSFDESMPASPTDDAKEVTVEMLDQLVKDIADTKNMIALSEAHTSELNKLKGGLEAKCVNYLKALGRDKYQSPHGNVSVTAKWRVNLPATDADKRAFFDWLREKGIFDKYATVNANSLQSLYMGEWDAATRAGVGMEFTLPGIGERKLFEGLSFRKAT